LCYGGNDCVVPVAEQYRRRWSVTLRLGAGRWETKKFTGVRDGRRSIIAMSIIVRLVVQPRGAGLKMRVVSGSRAVRVFALRVATREIELNPIRRDIRGDAAT